MCTRMKSISLSSISRIHSAELLKSSPVANGMAAWLLMWRNHSRAQGSSLGARRRWERGARAHHAAARLPGRACSSGIRKARARFRRMPAHQNKRLPDCLRGCSNNSTYPHTLPSDRGYTGSLSPGTVHMFFHFIRIPPVSMAVKRHALPAFTAEQPVYGHAGFLCHDIPQRHVATGYGVIQYGAVSPV
jgi:hypothetical protein